MMEYGCSLPAGVFSNRLMPCEVCGKQNLAFVSCSAEGGCGRKWCSTVDCLGRIYLNNGMCSECVEEHRVEEDDGAADIQDADDATMETDYDENQEEDDYYIHHHESDVSDDEDDLPNFDLGILSEDF